MVFIWTWVLDKSEALMKRRSTDCGGRTLEHFTKCLCVIFSSQNNLCKGLRLFTLSKLSCSLMVSCGRNVSNAACLAQQECGMRRKFAIFSDA